MIILATKNLSLHFGIKEIFNDINVQVENNAKIGLVGTNGAGKTSFLKVISGLMENTTGNVSMSDNLTINYLSQLSDFTCENTVFDEVMSVFADVYEMEQRIRDIEHQMSDVMGAELERISDEYNILVEKFEDINGYAIERQARSVLAGLNIKEDMYDRHVSTLSGGQRARVGLASVLLKKPDLLLLDEPTNHLDMDAISFLENYLSQYGAAFIVVSHDRYFMDKICKEIYEITMGMMHKYKGNYSEYIDKRDEVYEQMLKEFNANQKLINREEAIIARYRKWGRAKSLKAAKSREKRLDKVERMDKPKQESKVRFNFQVSGRSGDDVLICEGLSKNFGDKEIFNNLDMHIKSGEKIAIVGSNGIGKTTLLKIINKDIAPTKGDFRLGSGVQIGYYDQHQQNLDTNKTAVDEIWCTFSTLSHQQIRNTLALFLFRGDDIEKEVSLLSGGERARLSLLKLMLSKANLLILDEPTNHLDMDSREVLEAALMDFPGTLIFVSHDRYFINNIATKVIHMQSDEMSSYPGNWDDYLRHMAMLRNDDDSSIVVNKTQKAKLLKKQRQAQLAYKERRKELQEIESKIEDIESKLAEIEISLNNTSNMDNDEINKLSLSHQKLSVQLDNIMENWIELSSE